MLWLVRLLSLSVEVGFSHGVLGWVGLQTDGDHVTERRLEAFSSRTGRQVSASHCTSNKEAVLKHGVWGQLCGSDTKIPSPLC